MKNGQRGVSLIEVMVASVIFGMAVNGVMGLLGISATLDTDDGLRRQARVYAVNTIEQPRYHYSSFDTLAAATYDAPSVTLKTSTGQDVTGYIHIQVTGPTNATWNNPNDITTLIPVPYKTISVQVEWNLAGKIETFSLEKTISEMPI